ncbi:MAG: pyridoxamine 5'-phosphate oxidase [Pseudomonadota bacterium]|nr:pyridoxamine 5'-phosphate oxidase [Pseudomonadota bacterium]
MNIADLRTDYRRETLDEGDVAPDPIAQFERWLGEAIKAELAEPTAMSLATAATDGTPSSRIVLLKGVSAAGFVFFTNYESRKGRELAANPRAALLLHWVELERQVRIEGTVERVSEAESDAYFASRPIASRLSAWASPQSQVIAGRAVLEAAAGEVTERLKFHGEALPRPPHWGGYRVAPTAVEFWQGRRSRLHDRVRYRISPDEPGVWRIERLAP